MRAEILTTGDEIRSGVLIDSNSSFISQSLEENGFYVSRHQTVGDDPDAITEILNEIKKRADIAVVTGGLGPTSDDTTSLAAANSHNVSLVLNDGSLREIEKYFLKRNRVMSDSNRKQAVLPEGSMPLSNTIGTAPGFFMRMDRCLFFFLPGVPSEMKKMLEETVIPMLRSLVPEKNRMILENQTITTFGMPESVVGEKLRKFPELFPDVRLGFRAKFPEIQVKLYLEGEDMTYLQSRREEAAGWVTGRFPDNVISLNGESMAVIVAELLKKNRSTLALAESCTGGLIAHLMTNVPGCSDFFLFSAVTYSNLSKSSLLGVSSDTILKWGAVSEETVREMAQGARRISGSTYALATSGIAGPSGGTEEKPVGTVHVAIASPLSVLSRKYEFSYGDRQMNKKMFAYSALNLLRKQLLAESQFTGA